jgi:carbamoyl-phosphate synthase large subunit
MEIEKGRECNILITSAGRRTSLVRGFMKVLHNGERNYPGRVVTVDMDILSSALYFSDKYHIVPPVSHPSYLESLLDICLREEIRMIIPTTDEELSLFASKGKLFEKEGIKVLVSSLETVDLCDDKAKCTNFFIQNGLKVPRSAEVHEKEVLKNMKYPRVIKKKSGGHGSLYQHMVRDEEEFRFYLRYYQEPFVQEFLPGKEYTIDVLNNFQGRTVSVVPRERIETRAGVTDKGRTVKEPRLLEYGQIIAEGLRVVGPCNIQCILYQGEFYFIEVNPRFSGGILLTIEAGADFPLMLVQMLLGEEVRPQIGRFLEDLVVLRHQPGVFIDSSYRVIRME